MSARPSLPAAEGFSLVELMASMATALVVCGALFTLVDAARRTAAANAEVDDLQQRLRAALQTVAGELVNAGAGPDRTALAGSLGLVFPPVVPYRRGQVGDDAQAGVTFRPDVLSVAYVASSPPQAEVARTASDLGGRLRVELRPNCGPLAPVAGVRVRRRHAGGAARGVRRARFSDRGGRGRGRRARCRIGVCLSSTYAGGTAVLAHVIVHTYAAGPIPPRAYRS